MNWRNKLDDLFDTYVLRAAGKPWRYLLFPFGLMLLMLWQLTLLQKDSTFESFFGHDSELFLEFDRFRADYGRDKFYMVMIETDELYDREFLQGLSDFHTDLEQIPLVASVDSLVNARYIEYIDDDLIIDELLAELPGNETEFVALRHAIDNNPVYHKRLISDDHHYLAMLILPITYKRQMDEDGQQSLQSLLPSELSAILNDVKATTKKHGEFAKSIKIGGAAAIGVELNQAVESDFSLFTGTSFILVTVFLILMFRRLSGVLLPLLIIINGLVITMGMMPVLGFPVQITTAILPSFLLAVCVGDSVHLLSHFYTAYDQGQNKLEALQSAVRHTGVPMLFTSLTTAAGLISFASADLIPVAGLGLFGAIGAIVAFFSTILIFPPLITLMPIKMKAYSQTTAKTSVIDKGINRFLDLMVWMVRRFTGGIIAVSVLFFIAGVWATSQIPFSNDAMQWFDEDVEVRQANTAAEKVLAGSTPVELLIDTGRAGGALDPKFLIKLDDWINALLANGVNDIPVGSVTSLVTLIKETHRGLNNNAADYYKVPDDKQLIAQELLMVEMDQAYELNKFTDDSGRYLRLTIIIPWIDSILFPELVITLKQDYAQQVSDQQVLTVTGMSVMLGRFFTSMIEQMIDSYMIAGLIITLMMICLLGDIKLGLISMFPNLLPIISLMGLMYIFDFKLDMFTLLIGSIAIGLSVDDTIHFMHGYRKNFQQQKNVGLAVETTIRTTGKALLTTSLVLCCGFLTYALSSLNNLFNFGILTATCTLVALFSDLLLSPALMLAVYGRKPVAESDISNTQPKFT